MLYLCIIIQQDLFILLLLSQKVLQQFNAISTLSQYTHGSCHYILTAVATKSFTRGLREGGVITQVRFGFVKSYARLCVEVLAGA